MTRFQAASKSILAQLGLVRCSLLDPFGVGVGFGDGNGSRFAYPTLVGASPVEARRAAGGVVKVNAIGGQIHLPGTGSCSRACGPGKKISTDVLPLCPKKNDPG